MKFKYLLIAVSQLIVLLCNAQIIENGYYKRSKPYSDILYIKNDTILLQYPNLWGVSFFKGKISSEKIESIPFSNKINSIAYNIKRVKDEKTKCSFSIYFHEKKEKIINAPIECSIGYSDVYGQKHFSHLQFYIVNEIYYLILPDVDFDTAELAISVQGYIFDQIRLNINKNESLSFNLLFKYNVYYNEETKLIKYDIINKNKIALLYPKEIFIPNVRYLFFFKKRIIFNKISNINTNNIKIIKEQLTPSRTNILSTP